MNARRIAGGLLLLACSAAGAGAQQPYLVRDIDPTHLPASSGPDQFVATAGLVVMAASDETGRELWRTDGTASGTYQLVDACPGACSSGPSTLGSTPIGSFFMLADSGAFDLWMTKAEPNSTTRLTGPHYAFGRPAWVPQLASVFISARSPASGERLLRVTETGSTSEVTPASGAFAELSDSVPFAGRLYFLGRDTPGDPSLWLTDGTAAGTRALLAPPTAPATTYRGLVAVGRWLLFFERGSQLRLWRSDGTAVGSAAIASLHPEDRLVSVGGAKASGNRLFFELRPSSGRELWVTDGTPKGTRRLTAAGSTPDGGDPELVLAVVNRRTLLRLRDPRHGSELWTSDGTAAGTRLLGDLCRGACSSNWYPIGSLGKRLLLAASDGGSGIEPWITDGTAKGTRRLADLCPGTCDSAPQLLATLGNRILLTASTADRQTRVWVTDGTSGGTRELASTWPGRLTGVTVGNRVLFRGVDDAHGAELWVSDGTAAGTRLVRDLDATDAGGSFPLALAAVGNGIAFVASDGIKGRQPWTSDGTPEGTRRLAVIEPPLTDGDLLTLAASRVVVTSDGLSHLHAIDGSTGTVVDLADDGLFLPLATTGSAALYANVRLDGWHLCRTDGTAAGTRCIFDGSFSDLVTWSGYGFFFARRFGGGPALFKTDGTRENTGVVLALDLAAWPRALTATGGRLFFLALAASASTEELWVSDGTAAGTHPLAALSLPAISGPRAIVAVGSQIFVIAPEGVWVVDGAPASSRKLAVVPPTTTLPSGVAPAAIGNIVYFTASGPASETVLWRSDGSEAGTYPILDAAAQPLNSPWILRSFAGSLVVGARHGGDDALWITDGSPASTRPLMRVDRVNCRELVESGSRLYFPASSLELGTELWALPDH